MSAMYALWPGMLPMLFRLKKRLLTRLKTMTSNASPSNDGSAPGTPERTRPM